MVIKRAKAWLGAVLALYTLFMLYELFLGGYRLPRGEVMYNLVPFKTILRYLTQSRHFNFNILVINLGGNIGVFMPVGLLLPLLFKSLRRFLRLFIVCALIISLVEVMQLVLEVGVCDVDDLILNLAGVSAGFGLFCLGRAVFPSFLPFIDNPVPK